MRTQRFRSRLLTLTVVTVFAVCATSAMLRVALDHPGGLDRLVALDGSALFSDKALLKELHRQLIQAVICAAILLPLIVRMIRKGVSEPLAVLEHQVATLARGDLEASIDPSRADQFGGLVDGLEGMRKSLRQSYDEIFQQNDRMRELMQMKDEMIGTASHELRTPLTSIRGFVQLMASERAGPLTERQTDLLTRIGRNSDRLTMLVTDLLDIERVDKTSLTLAPVAVAPLLDEVIKEQDSRLRAKGLDLVVSVPSHTQVVADRERLREVFVNLLTNAIKYTREGSIHIRCRHGYDRVSIEFEDTGIGIPNHLLPHIFDRFYRATDEYVQNMEGSGLGLAIVKRLITRQNGTITVSSEPDKGSTFQLNLPRSLQHNENATVADQVQVLVATADPLGQAVYGATFSDDRYDVSFASSSSGVFMRARRARPEIVLLDLDDGSIDEVLHRLPLTRGMEDVTFVVLSDERSGATPASDRVHYVGSIIKPNQVLDLVECLCPANPEPADSSNRLTEAATR